MDEIPRSRKEAMLLGVSKYETGKECKNGHRTYRYTQSGACSDCLRANRVMEIHGGAEKAAEEKLKRAILRDAVSNLVEVRLRCFTQELHFLREIVVATTRGRWPMLDKYQIVSAKPPTDQAAGTALYRFNVDPADIEQLRAVSNVLLKKHGANGNEVREKVLGKVLQMIEDEATDETPEFDPTKC
jgi:hypothetical protein